MAEIGALQLRHLPPSISQLKIGILSYGFIGVLHFGHAEFGKTIDSSFGTRWMTTFRKLPTAAPNTENENITDRSGKPVRTSNENEQICNYVVREGKEGKKEPKTSFLIINLYLAKWKIVAKSSVISYRVVHTTCCSSIDFILCIRATAIRGG